MTIVLYPVRNFYMSFKEVHIAAIAEYSGKLLHKLASVILKLNRLVYIMS